MHGVSFRSRCQIESFCMKALGTTGRGNGMLKFTACLVTFREFDFKIYCSLKVCFQIPGVVCKGNAFTISM